MGADEAGWHPHCPRDLIMRIARPLTHDLTLFLHPPGSEPLPSHAAGLLWYTAVMFVGASVGTIGALVYSLAL